MGHLVFSRLAIEQFSSISAKVDSMNDTSVSKIKIFQKLLLSILSAKIDTYFDELKNRLDIMMKKYAIDFRSLFSEHTVRIVSDLCRFFR